MKRALVRGAGDVATAVTLVLRQEGYRVFCTERPHPTALRRMVSFAEAVYEGTWTVDGVEARPARTVPEAVALADRGAIPVLVPEGDAIPELNPELLVDARMAKRNLGTGVDEAPTVIGLGPGFTAGEDCHAAVETLSGPELGRVHLEGSPLAPTHHPSVIGGLGDKRVLRAPSEEPFVGFLKIGERVATGDWVASCGRHRLYAPCSGVIWGILRPGITVPAGTKAVEVDPRGDPDLPYRVADRARTVASGVLASLERVRR